MSTYVLMRVLESAPSRYERGMRVLTFGRVDRAMDSLAARVEPGWRVLDVGCGTGALTRRLARRGAVVRGIDTNAAMLAIARRRLVDERLTERVELIETGVADLDGEADETYDAVTASLCLSELGEDELVYCLRHVARILRPGGRFLVADEVRPRHLLQRVVHNVLRLPLVVLAYLLTQQTTHAVRDLPARLAAAGLEVRTVETGRLGSFGTFVAVRPAVGGGR